MCSEGFFFDKNVTNLCRPICGEFNPLVHAAVIFEIASLFVASIASVVVIVLALTARRKTM